MTTLELLARYRELNRKAISVAEYHAMGEDGTLTEKDKVELIRGQLVPKTVKNPPHTKTLRRLDRLFSKMLDAVWEIGVESPITLADSEPEPDISLVRAQQPDDEDRRDTPADCGLVIEVADSSLRDDRTEMLELYAEAGIPICWIVNIPDRQIEVYELPTANGEYGRKTIYRDGDSVPVVLDGRAMGALAVSEILPVGKRG